MAFLYSCSWKEKYSGKSIIFSTLYLFCELLLLYQLCVKIDIIFEQLLMCTFSITIRISNLLCPIFLSNMIHHALHLEEFHVYVQRQQLILSIADYEGIHQLPCLASIASTFHGFIASNPTVHVQRPFLSQINQ